MVIVRCPHCGRLQKIDGITREQGEVYVFPGSVKVSREFFLDQKEVLHYKEHRCSVCGNLHTLTVTQKVYAPAEELDIYSKFKMPLFLKLALFQLRSPLPIVSRKLTIFPFQQLIFFLAFYEYSKQNEDTSIIFSSIYISVMFLSIAIRKFAKLNFFIEFPISLSEDYLNEHSLVLDYLFKKQVFKELATFELIAMFISAIIALKSTFEPKTFFTLVGLCDFGKALLFLLIFGEIVMIPTMTLIRIGRIFEVFPPVIDFRKGPSFDKVGNIIFTLLLAPLVFSIGIPLTILTQYPDAKAAISLYLRATGVLIGFISYGGIGLLITYHQKIREAKLKELSKLQTLLQKYYVLLENGEREAFEKFSTIKKALDLVNSVEEWPRSLKYGISILGTIGTVMLYVLIGHLLE